MIVVDTSVWVDLLRPRRTKVAVRCEELIQNGEPVALTDVIYAELMQGVQSPREVRLLDRHLRTFPILRLESLEDFALAAELYRTARRHGITIRKTLDCLIAAPCVRTKAPLLHKDADFDRLASCTSLRIFT